MHITHTAPSDPMQRRIPAAMVRYSARRRTRAHLHSEADLLVQDHKQLRDRRVVGARRHLHPLRQHLRAIP